MNAYTVGDRIEDRSGQRIKARTGNGTRQSWEKARSGCALFTLVGMKRVATIADSLVVPSSAQPAGARAKREDQKRPSPNL